MQDLAPELKKLRADRLAPRYATRSPGDHGRNVDPWRGGHAVRLLHTVAPRSVRDFRVGSLHKLHQKVCGIAVGLWIDRPVVQSSLEGVLLQTDLGDRGHWRRAHSPSNGKVRLETSQRWIVIETLDEAILRRRHECGEGAEKRFERSVNRVLGS